MLRSKLVKVLKMQTTLYLARHGETLWNAQQRFQGHLDSELTALGKQQSQELAKLLTPQNIDVIISSPLERALYTAKICQSKLQKQLTINPQLIERNLGEWQGQYHNKVKQHPNYHETFKQVTNLAIANSESALSCALRYQQAILSIAKDNLQQSILLICHGEALRCLFHLLGCNHQGDAYQLYKNAGFTTLQYHHSTHSLSLLTNNNQ